MFTCIGAAYSSPCSTKSAEVARKAQKLEPCWIGDVLLSLVYAAFATLGFTGVLPMECGITFTVVGTLQIATTSIIKFFMIKAIDRAEFE